MKNAHHLTGFDFVRAQAGSRALRSLTALALALLMGSGFGCAGRKARKAREQAPTLVIGQPVENSIHCDHGECDDWYRIVLRDRKTVRIEADAPADPALPDFGLSLLDAQLVVLGDERADRIRPRRIDKELAPGLYYVHVFGLGDNRDQASYKLVAKPQSRNRRSSGSGRSTSKPARRRSTSPTIAPKPAIQQQPTLTSEILEVERAGGEPTAVLLEAGLGEGMEAGTVGRLMDSGQEIGRIEVIDVYADGSRARIVGGLSAPITLDTRAEMNP